VPEPLLTALDGRTLVDDPEAPEDLVVASASEILSDGREGLPAWVGSETRYLVLVDVPEPAVLRLPTILAVHKPDQRMHVTRDPRAIPRLLIALHRDHAWEGIVDAYVVGGGLVTVLGDLSTRTFPRAALPRVSGLDCDDFEAFEIDDSGSFLYWPAADAHLGPSQMLQAVDPMALADVEIERYAREKMSLVLLDMRQERGLRQVDIPGLSERHVRRLEKEGARLTVEAAERYAAAFGQSLTELLDEVSQRVGRLADRDATTAPAS
jgi:hypothetical protein